MIRDFAFKKQIQDILDGNGDPELRRLAALAVERMKNDTRADEEKLKGMVDFILYGPGGD